ncbi:MAG: alpha/beta hydrolase [Sphingomonas sp.]
MKRIALLAALTLASCHAGRSGHGHAGNEAANAEAAAPSTVWATSPDRINIRGDLYAAENPKAIILLFHQADSSKEEYATIAPRLVAAGYTAMAIDQRSGGAMFGINETMKNVKHKPEMVDAENDLIGAVNWARPFGKPIILWGSSYSASLVFDVANVYPANVKAVMAFSPGEYFPDPHMVGRAASTLAVPAYITSSSDPVEIAKAKAIADQVPGGKAEQYVPATGVHGSSTLIAAKDPKGAEANWASALAFLKKVAP